MIEKLEGKKHWDERRLENDWIGFIMKTYYFQMLVLDFCIDFLFNNTRIVLYDKYHIFVKFYYIITKMIMSIKKKCKVLIFAYFFTIFISYKKK